MPSLSTDAYLIAKRLLDVIGSLILIVLLSPVMLGIAIAIWLDSGLPIMYRSQRIGRHRIPIVVLKFRTMRDGSHHHLTELLSANESGAGRFAASG